MAPAENLTIFSNSFKGGRLKKYIYTLDIFYWIFKKVNKNINIYCILGSRSVDAFVTKNDFSSLST